MGWYFFVFVPQKLEYYVGQRFRTLAVASGQIKGKSESLGQSLNNAPSLPNDKSVAPNPLDSTGAPAERATEKYLRLLVPDIQLEKSSTPGTAARPTGLRLTVTRATSESLRATVAWDRVAALGAAASASDFDDLVVANKAAKLSGGARRPRRVSATSSSCSTRSTTGARCCRRPGPSGVCLRTSGRRKDCRRPRR